MLQGDLAETALSAALQALAQEWASGCLHVVDPDGGEALVYLREGAIYFIAMPHPGRRLGNRLVSSGALVPAALAEALDAQEGALQAWRLGELLVRLGYVDQSVVEAFVIEQVLEDGADLLGLTAGHWEFVDGESTREGIAGGLSAAELLRQVIERQRAWSRLVKLVPGPDAVPRVSPAGLAADTALDLSSDAWAAIGHVDGKRSVRELADLCGFTLFEATYVIARLVHGGSLDIVVPSRADAEPEPEIEVEVSPEVDPQPALEPAVELTVIPDLPVPRAPVAEEAEPSIEAAVWQASALLSELSREYDAEEAEEVEDEVPEPAVEYEPGDPADEAHPSVHLNDTASLMRELSFLGLDDPPDNPPVSSPPSRPYTPSAQKKRKGLFGR